MSSININSSSKYSCSNWDINSGSSTSNSCRIKIITVVVAVAPLSSALQAPTLVPRTRYSYILIVTDQMVGKLQQYVRTYVCSSHLTVLSINTLVRAAVRSRISSKLILASCVGYIDSRWCVLFNTAAVWPHEGNAVRIRMRKTKSEAAEFKE